MHEDGRIDYVELPAGDFDDVRHFYGTVFGWSFKAFGEDYLAFDDGRLQGGFYRAEGQCSGTDRGCALIVFHANDLEATETEIVNAGGRIVKPVFDFPGGRRFHFNDPHGNELAVWSENAGDPA